MLPDLIELPVGVLPGQPPLAVPRLPHAPPFRLLDRVLHIDAAQGTLWAQKRVSINDALWPAEGSTLPSMIPPATLPALLLIEALSQAAACFNLLSADLASSTAGAGSTQGPSLQQGHLGFLVSVSDFRFPALASDGAHVGDTVLLHVQKQESLGALVAFSARALCLLDQRPPARVKGTHSPGSDPRPSATEETLPRARILGQGRLLFAVTSK